MSLLYSKSQRLAKRSHKNTWENLLLEARTGDTMVLCIPYNLMEIDTIKPHKAVIYTRAILNSFLKMLPLAAAPEQETLDALSNPSNWCRATGTWVPEITQFIEQELAYKISTTTKQLKYGGRPVLWQPDLKFLTRTHNLTRRPPSRSVMDTVWFHARKGYLSPKNCQEYGKILRECGQEKRYINLAGALWGALEDLYVPQGVRDWKAEGEEGLF